MIIGLPMNTHDSEITDIMNQGQRLNWHRVQADQFRTGTFFSIVDNVTVQLKKRLDAYADIAAKFGFLRNLNTLSEADVISSADLLRDAYPSDLEPSLSDELVQFSALLKGDFAKRTMRTCPQETHTVADNDDADNDDVTFMGESVELRMHRMVVDNHMETLFPNTAIALRIYLCFLISNCSGERSFSKLARIISGFL